MCVAIYKPAKKTIAKAVLEACAEQNPDGCGMAYINAEGKIVIAKEMKFADFYPKYARAFKENMDSPFLIHFRVATKGTVSLENCHPFRIDEHHVFIHNGTITPLPCGKTEDKSDTRMFNETVLQHLPDGWMHNKGITRLIEDFIDHSKIVVMDSTGDVSLYNESAGFWKEGVWFSNTRHEWRLNKGKSQGDAYEWKGVRRRWLAGSCEAWDPVYKIWVKYDGATQKLVDGQPVESLIDPERVKGASQHHSRVGERCHECFYCRIYVPESKVGVYMVEGQRAIACDNCAKEVTDWGVEMYRIIGGYLGQGRLLACG